jgi:hypothetical protein
MESLGIKGRYPTEAGNIYFITVPKQNLGNIQNLIKRVPGNILSGVIWPGRSSNFSLLGYMTRKFI